MPDGFVMLNTEERVEWWPYLLFEDIEPQTHSTKTHKIILQNTHRLDCMILIIIKFDQVSGFSKLHLNPRHEVPS